MADIWIFTNLTTLEVLFVCAMICFVAVFGWLTISSVVALIMNGGKHEK